MNDLATLQGGIYQEKCNDICYFVYFGYHTVDIMNKQLNILNKQVGHVYLSFFIDNINYPNWTVNDYVEHQIQNNNLFYLSTFEIYDDFKIHDGLCGINESCKSNSNICKEYSYYDYKDQIFKYASIL